MVKGIKEREKYYYPILIHIDYNCKRWIEGKDHVNLFGKKESVLECRFKIDLDLATIYLN